MKCDLGTKWRMMSTITADPCSTRGDIAVAVYLLDRLDADGQAYPSFEAIAKATQQTVRNAQRCIRKLTGQDEAHPGYNYFSCQPGGGRRRSNTYRLIAATQPRPETSAPGSMTLSRKTWTSVSQNLDIPVPETGTSASIDSIRETPSHYSMGCSGQQTPPSEYTFSGQVIRLTHRDFAQWREAFRAIPDLRAELAVIDAELADRGHRGKWFVMVARWLRWKHEALLRARTRGHEAGVSRTSYVDRALDVAREMAGTYETEVIR